MAVVSLKVSPIRARRLTHAGGAPRGEISAHLPPQAFVSFLQNHDQVGNRAFGERIAALAEPEKLSLAHAVLILGPQIPMLFMGEDWSASTPFQFFVDFSDDAQLSDAVREGRRREFARFAAFASDEQASAIPDPTDPATFASSTLRWEERLRAPHAQKLEEMRRLIGLRREHVAPLLQSAFEGANYRLHGDNGLDVHWRFGAGDLRAFLQFEGSRHVPLHGAQKVIWTSGKAGAGGQALTPWTGLFTLELKHARRVRIEFAALAKRLGVAASYLDQGEAQVEISRETQAALMEALGFPASTPAQLRDAHQQLDAQQGLLPRWLVLDAGVAQVIELPKGAKPPRCDDLWRQRISFRAAPARPHRNSSA